MKYSILPYLLYYLSLIIGYPVSCTNRMSGTQHLSDIPVTDQWCQGCMGQPWLRAAPLDRTDGTLATNVRDTGSKLVIIRRNSIALIG